MGNPAIPEKARPAKPAPELARAGADARTTSEAIRVALLYKRNAQPDEQLLLFLEQQFKAEGFHVFIDRHMAIGVEWAQEIERQVRTSDAVIPLVSTLSMHSEMLSYELQIAHEAAQKQDGKPRILPVRISYVGPLPEQLATILDPNATASSW